MRVLNKTTKVQVFSGYIHIYTRIKRYVNTCMYTFYNGILINNHSYPRGHQVSWLSPIPLVSVASFYQVQLQRQTSCWDPRLLPFPPPSGKRPTWKYASMFSTSSRVRLPCMFVYTNRTDAVTNPNSVLVTGVFRAALETGKMGHCEDLRVFGEGQSPVLTPVNTEGWTRDNLMLSRGSPIQVVVLIQQLVTNADPPGVHGRLGLFGQEERGTNAVGERCRGMLPHAVWYRVRGRKNDHRGLYGGPSWGHHPLPNDNTTFKMGV